MPALIQLFEQQRESLHLTLSADPGLESVVRETRHWLDSQRFLYAEQPDCSEAQRRLLPFVSDLLKASLQPLAAASRTQLWKREAARKTVSSHKSWYHRPVLWRGAQILLLVPLSGILLDGENLQVLLGFVLLLGIVTLEVLNLNPHDSLRDLIARQQAGDGEAEWQVRVEVELSDFLRGLADTLITADKLLNEAAALLAPAKNPNDGEGLETYPEILTFFQDLLEARDTGDSAYALKKAKTVPAILEQHGVSIQHFTGENPQWFDFLPSLDPEQDGARTVSPALLKEDRLLARGRVTEPG
jgi:hypothetical protein